jgi:uncharacterized protein YndB with AHSA1/START domain
MSSELSTLRTSRVLPFSAKAIYQAFSNPQLLAQWWGPEGFSNTFAVFEFIVGGRWQFTMHGPDGTDYTNESQFTALVPDQKVVIAHVCAPLFTLTIELTPLQNGTQLSWVQIFADEQAAHIVRQLYPLANEQNLDRLTQVLNQAPTV